MGSVNVPIRGGRQRLARERECRGVTLDVVNGGHCPKHGLRVLDDDVEGLAKAFDPLGVVGLDQQLAKDVCARRPHEADATGLDEVDYVAQLSGVEVVPVVRCTEPPKLANSLKLADGLERRSSLVHYPLSLNGQLG